MSRYHGKELKAYVSTSGSGNAVPVAGVTGWTFDGSTDKVDVTAGGDSGKQQVVGHPNNAGTIAFVWDDTDSTLFEAAASADGCKIYLYRDAANAESKYRYGTAYLDVSEDVNVTSASTGSCSFVAKGAWDYK